MNIEVYSANTDSMMPVTQEWCDRMQKQAGLRASLHRTVHRILGLNIIGEATRIKAIIEAVDKVLESVPVNSLKQ